MPSRIAAAAISLATATLAARPSHVPVRQAPDEAPVYGTYAWPLRGRVLRPFEPPAGPFGAGHRGIDIEALLATPVRAAEGGRVAFAGRIAGERFVSVDHPDGVRTSYSWLSDIAVRRGDQVMRGQVLGASGVGHPGPPPAHLHFGARIGDAYIDPMLLLEGGGVAGLIHLAPLERGSAAYRMGEPCPCPPSRASFSLSASWPGALPRRQRPTGPPWAGGAPTRAWRTARSPRTGSPGPPS